MRKEFETKELCVPDLNVLCDDGIISKMTELYTLDRETGLMNYPIFNNYDEEKIPIYLTYFAICEHFLEENDDNIAKFLQDLNDSTYLYQVFDKSVSEFALLLGDLETLESSYEELYENYKNEFKNMLIKDPKVIKFMKELYTDRVVNAVKNYLLTTGGLSVEKIGLDYDTEQTIDLGVYVYYSVLYSYYKSLCKTPISKFKYKRNVRRLDSNDINSLAAVYFEEFDKKLYTFDEYVEYLVQRKRYALEILVMSDNQFNRYSSFVRGREE